MKRPDPLSSAGSDPRLVVDTIPVMAWITGADGRPEFMNRTWLDYSGLSMEDALADPTGTLHPDDLPRVMAKWNEHFENGQPYEDEIRLRRADGQYRWFLVRTVPLREPDGRIARWYGTSTDIEDRVRAEEALRRSERLLREAQELGRTGSWEHDLETGRIANSPENLRLFFGDDRSKGARLEDFADAVHPDDRARVLQQRERLLLDEGGGLGPHEIEFRVIWPNGEIHILNGLATIVRDASGRPIRFYGTNLDVTERRRAEETIRRDTQMLQALTRRMVELQETERRELSRELHDRAGQMLTAMLINMNLLRVRAALRDDPEARKRIEDSIELIQLTFTAVKDVMYELRPPMLDEQGLAAPLEWYAKLFTDRTGIAVRVVSDAGWRCDPGVELALFRIAQEGLTNIARHAKATSAVVTLSLGEDEASLTVEDDGVGMGKSSRPGLPGYGMITMRERAEAVRGTFHAGPRPGGGTRLSVRVPAHCTFAPA